MRDFGLLILRLTLGGLLAGHGAQKLFGAFEGHGIQGTGAFMEKLGLAPGERWALTAGLGEFGGGVFTALGLLHPIGPLMTVAPMSVAWGRAHWGKPIWVTSGGAELPLTNIAMAAALVMLGPGRWSGDRLLGIRTPAALSAFAAACVAIGTFMALTAQPQPAEQQAQPAEQPAEAVAAT